MRINVCIVTAEARVNAQVVRVAEMTTRGQNKMQEEALLSSYHTSLDLLRAIQTQLLLDTATVLADEQ